MPDPTDKRALFPADLLLSAICTTAGIDVMGADRYGPAREACQRFVESIRAPEAEADSPPFTPPELTDLAARGYVRRNRRAPEAEGGGTVLNGEAWDKFAKVASIDAPSDRTSVTEACGAWGNPGATPHPVSTPSRPGQTEEGGTSSAPSEDGEGPDPQRVWHVVDDIREGKRGNGTMVPFPFEGVYAVVQEYERRIAELEAEKSRLVRAIRAVPTDPIYTLRSRILAAAQGVCEEHGRSLPCGACDGADAEIERRCAELEAERSTEDGPRLFVNFNAQGAAIDVFHERDQAERRPGHGDIREYVPAVSVVGPKAQLIAAFVPEPDRAACARHPLARVVQHAIEHHQWHHGAQDSVYVASVEAERDAAVKRAEEAEARGRDATEHIIGLDDALAEADRRAVEAERVAYDRMTHILALTSAAETTKRDLEQSRADYAACAAAIGIEHVQDMGPSYPGPVEAVVRHIEEARRDAGTLIDVRNDLEQARSELTDARERNNQTSAAYSARTRELEQARAALDESRTVMETILGLGVLNLVDHGITKPRAEALLERLSAMHDDPARLDADRAEKRAKCGMCGDGGTVCTDHRECVGECAFEPRLPCPSCTPAPSAADEEKAKRWGVWYLAQKYGEAPLFAGTREEAITWSTERREDGGPFRIRALMAAEDEAGKEMNRG